MMSLELAKNPVKQLFLFKNVSSTDFFIFLLDSSLRIGMTFVILLTFVLIILINRINKISGSDFFLLDSSLPYQ
jgi:hypothetical protein